MGEVAFRPRRFRRRSGRAASPRPPVQDGRAQHRWASSSHHPRRARTVTALRRRAAAASYSATFSGKGTRCSTGFHESSAEGRRATGTRARPGSDGLCRTAREWYALSRSTLTVGQRLKRRCEAAYSMAKTAWGQVGQPRASRPMARARGMSPSILLTCLALALVCLWWAEPIRSLGPMRRVT